MLKHETKENITEYLKQQGVTACKRFTIKKDGNLLETNTLLLTFNTTSLPKSLKIFFRIIPVEVYIPNPLRCFNCQRFGHHENSCPKLPGSVCENVVWVILTTLHMLAKMKPSARTVTKITYQNQINVKFRKKKKKL